MMTDGAKSNRGLKQSSKIMLINRHRSHPLQLTEFLP